MSPFFLSFYLIKAQKNIAQIILIVCAIFLVKFVSIATSSMISEFFYYNEAISHKNRSLFVKILSDNTVTALFLAAAPFLPVFPIIFVPSVTVKG